jgi:hypothetical protein
MAKCEVDKSEAPLVINDRLVAQVNQKIRAKLADRLFNPGKGIPLRYNRNTQLKKLAPLLYLLSSSNEYRRREFVA